MGKLSSEQQEKATKLLALLYAHLADVTGVIAQLEREAMRLRSASARLALQADQLLREIEKI